MRLRADRILVAAIVAGAASLLFGVTAASAVGPDTWDTKASMPSPRAFGANGVINGRLYVTDGHNGNGSEIFPVAEYDPAADAWTGKASPPIARAHSAAAAVGGKLYVIGGCLGADCSSITSQVRVYDPATNTWSSVAPAPSGRALPAAAAIGTKIYLVGGHGPGGTALSSLDIYDTVANTWTTGASMPTADMG